MLSRSFGNLRAGGILLSLRLIFLVSSRTPTLVFCCSSFLLKNAGQPGRDLRLMRAHKTCCFFANSFNFNPTASATRPPMPTSFRQRPPIFSIFWFCVSLKSTSTARLRRRKRLLQRFRRFADVCRNKIRFGQSLCSQLFVWNFFCKSVSEGASILTSNRAFSSATAFRFASTSFSNLPLPLFAYRGFPRRF